MIQKLTLLGQVALKIYLAKIAAGDATPEETNCIVNAAYLLDAMRNRGCIEGEPPQAEAPGATTPDNTDGDSRSIDRKSGEEGYFWNYKDMIYGGTLSKVRDVDTFRFQDQEGRIFRHFLPKDAQLPEWIKGPFLQ